MPFFRALPSVHVPTLDEYLKDKSYYHEMVVGAMISICAIVALIVWFYMVCNQNAKTALDKFVTTAKSEHLPSLEMDEEEPEEDPAEPSSDIENPPFRPPVEIIIPADASPVISAIHMQVYCTTPRRRAIARVHSAPSFTVPLSPSDSPKCVF
jgi:hypothetical protein